MLMACGALSSSQDETDCAEGEQVALRDGKP